MYFVIYYIVLHVHVYMCTFKHVIFKLLLLLSITIPPCLFSTCTMYMYIIHVHCICLCTSLHLCIVEILFCYCSLQNLVVLEARENILRRVPP